MSEERFQMNEQTISIVREIGRHMPGGFFIYREEQPEEILYANKAVFDIFGCDGPEDFRALTGNTFKGMLHPEDYEAISSSISQQIGHSDDHMDYVEYRVIRKDGEVRWVDDYGHYTRTRAYGGIYYVFISDITEKKQRIASDMAVRQAVIEALSESYHTVWLINDVETENFSLYRSDLAGDSAYAAPIREALKRMKYSQAKEYYIRTMVAPSDRERLQRELTLPSIVDRLKKRPQYNVNYLRLMEDGSERYFRIEFARVNMPGGAMGVVCGFKDVDLDVRQGLALQKAQRQELEQRLQLQEELLRHEKQRQELDSMITAMASDYRSVYHVDLDADDAVCYRADPDDPNQTPEGVHFPFHARFLRYCDLYVDSAYQEGFRQFVDPANIRAALAGENIIAYRYLARRNGAEFYEMLRMAGVRHPADRDDHIVHAVGVGFTVIDEEMRQAMAQNRALRDALAAAQEANKAKTAFLSNMSHEIRTPMNAIIGLDNIALSNPNLPPETRDQLEKIGASAQHLLSIINEILDMSRIESGRMSVNNEEFSFSKALEQVNTIIGGQCRDKGVAYECRLRGRIDEYYIGDEMKLRQVLINILGNAVKFTPEGGAISFLVEEAARFDGKATLRFTISDTGIGMSREFLPKLFDTFSQEDTTAANRYGSTGLGMPITKSLVELMNGQIEVQSEQGKGTTFTVTVTLTESDRTDAEDGVEIHPHEMAVLVIDDDPVACDHARTVLGQMGVNCDIASSGAEGVEMVRVRHARREPYNLILVDWKMPGMDGVETTRRIRGVVGHESAIVILTSYNWDDIADEARAAGVDTFVPKPLFAGSVLDEFREAFRKKNAALQEKTVDLKGRRVLLAEDVSVNAEIMLMVLAMREMEADLAENGRVAVELFQRRDPGYYDAILMDMRMPVMDGLEATRAIRAMDRADAKAIPIIALTANAFDEDVQRSMQAGLNAHLSKPVQPEALFETLESLIGR